MQLKAIERRILKEMIHDCEISESLTQRARIILLAAEGHDDDAIAEKLNACKQDSVKAWRKRWALTSKKLPIFEFSPKMLRKQIEKLLTDELHPQIPASFSPEDICQLFALSGEKSHGHLSK